MPVDKTFVTAATLIEYLFRIIDISEGGISFFSENNFEPDKSLDICTRHSDFCLGVEVKNCISTQSETDDGRGYRVGTQFQPWVSMERRVDIIRRIT